MSEVSLYPGAQLFWFQNGALFKAVMCGRDISIGTLNREP